MNKYETWAWRLSLIYTCGALLLGFYHPFSMASFLFQIWLLGMFYLGFKKGQWFFSTLTFGWLSFGTLQAVYRLLTQVLPLFNEEGFYAILMGAVGSLIFMLILTYFTLRVLAEQMKYRFGKPLSK